MTRQEWLSTASRTFEQKTKEQVIEAVQKVLVLADGKDFTFVHNEEGIIASRNWTAYMVIASASGTDFWKLIVQETPKGAKANIAISTTSSSVVPMPVADRPVNSIPAIYRNSSDNSRLVTFNPQTNKMSQLESQAGRMLDVSFTGSLATTGNATKITGWNAPVVGGGLEGFWDNVNDEWVAPRDMAVSVFVKVNLAGAPSQEAARLLKNGATWTTLGTGDATPHFVVFMQLSTGDKLSVAGYTSAGAGETINGARLQIMQISA